MGQEGLKVKWETMQGVQMWLNLQCTCAVVCNMAIRVVEFSNGGYNIRKVLPKNQYTPRKLLNFENWVNGGLRSFQKSEF